MSREYKSMKNRKSTLYLQSFLREKCIIVSAGQLREIARVVNGASVYLGQPLARKVQLEIDTHIKGIICRGRREVLQRKQTKCLPDPKAEAAELAKLIERSLYVFSVN